MSPILGIFASAVTGGVSTTSFESIATVTVGINGASDITFSSIPSTYTHLQVRAIARSEEAAGGVATLRMQINGDSGTNYAQHYLDGNGTSATSGATSSISYALGALSAPKDSALASTYAGIVVDFLDYKSTNKYKTIRTLSGVDLQFQGNIDLTSSLWMSTDAITSIKFYFNANALKRYSHFALYGIKVAS
jgi:hypothetical protein